MRTVGSTKQYTKEIVLEAIKGSGAITQVIAGRLKCSWDTARKYINKWEETRIAYKNEEEIILDMCESAIYNSIKDGNTQDAKWMLVMRAKRRGYVEKYELEHTGDDRKLIVEIVRSENKNPGSV